LRHRPGAIAKCGRQQEIEDELFDYGAGLVFIEPGGCTMETIDDQETNDEKHDASSRLPQISYQPHEGASNHPTTDGAID